MSAGATGGVLAAPGDAEGRRVPAPTRTRARFALMSALLVTACTVSALVLNLLAERFPVRVDVTATREQELSPRTRGVLASLGGDYEVVLAGDWGAIDPRAARRARDVLDLLARGSRRVTTTVIDTTTAAGAETYQRLLARLAERDRAAAERQNGTLGAAIDAARGAAETMAGLAPRFQAVRDAIPAEAAGAKSNRDYFEFQAAQFRVNSGALGEIAEASREAAGKPAGPIGIPDLVQASAPLKKSLSDLESGLRQVASSVRQFAGAESMPAAARSMAGPLAEEVGRLRDAVAIHAEALARLPKLDSVRVARTLQASQAALVVGPPEAGVTAIPFEWLFPPGDAIDAAGESRADMRRRNEELFATALDTLARPVTPIVVLVHSWPPPPLLDRQRGFGSLVERLGLRGIDVVEWAVSERADPPSLRALDPKGERPVVYVTFSADTTGTTVAGQNAAERADKLAAALATLVEQGKPLLLSIIPSVFPTVGSPDRVVAFLPLFGLKADSARPLMRDTLTPAGRAVVPEFQVLANEASPTHPIAGAVRGLRTQLEWPLPLEVLRESEAPRARVWPLFSVTDRDAWAESEWVSLWQWAMSDTRRTAAPPPPVADASRDDVSGPWVVGAAAERDLPGGGGVQRLVVIGSNRWFSDRVTSQRARLVDGRLAGANPGNIELFESAIFWLAGQDDRIGASATARAVPVIRAMGPGTLAALRWLTILGLPALTLAAGLSWRLWRG